METVMQSRLLGAVLTCILTLSASLTTMVFSASNAHASAMTFNFSGELSSVGTPLSGAFTTGNKFSGSYTFDSNATSNQSGPSPIAFFTNAISNLSLSVGSDPYTALATNGDIGYDFESSPEDYTYNASSTGSISAASAEGNTLTGLTLTWTPNNLPSQMGALSEETLFGPSSNGILIMYFDGSNGPSQIRGTLDSITIAHMPVPTAVWLFGSGLLGLVGFAKRKQQTS
jgi:hypothetical protein